MERIATNDGKVKAVSDCKWTEIAPVTTIRPIRGAEGMISRHAGTRREKDILFKITKENTIVYSFHDYFVDEYFLYLVPVWK